MFFVLVSGIVSKLSSIKNVQSMRINLAIETISSNNFNGDLFWKTLLQHPQQPSVEAKYGPQLILYYLGVR